MLVVRAPMRISFAGGGTDLPAYYETHGGMVVSTAIDKYVYVFMSQNGHGSLQISSADYSTFIRHEGGELPEDGRLRYARMFLREYGVRAGHSMFIASEMPPGSGLGSSSALSVALTKALAALAGKLPPKWEVAERAADIEIRRLQMPIGKQDHYASAFGGLNAIYFTQDRVEVEPLEVADSTLDWLERSIMIFFTEMQHNSGEILAEQTQRSREQEPVAIDALHTIKGHAHEARSALLDGEPEKLGEIMHRSWMQKKKLARGVTNPKIDDAYADAIGAGALGGKIMGAGGGGFLMLVCPPGTQGAVGTAMRDNGLIRSDFHADNGGARILVNNVAA